MALVQRLSSSAVLSKAADCSLHRLPAIEIIAVMPVWWLREACSGVRPATVRSRHRAYWRNRASTNKSVKREELVAANYCDPHSEKQQLQQRRQPWGCENTASQHTNLLYFPVYATISNCRRL